MPSRNEHSSVRHGLRAFLVCLLIICLSPVDAGARTDGFDPVRGKRIMGAALASSAMEHSAGAEFSTPRTSDQLLLMFLINPRYNAYLWRHPETMPSVADRMTEPGFLLAVYQAAMEPASYLHFLKGWTDIERLRGYFEIMDPAVFLAWVGAAMDLNSYAAMHERMAAPEKLRNWMLFALGSRMPEILHPVATPKTVLDWITLPVNPETYRQLQGPMRMLNPMQPLILWDALFESSQQAMRRFLSPGAADHEH